jgi:acyl carrier protein
VGREDAPGDKRLVAYVIPKPGSQPTDQDLRSFLSSQLPAFMVPAIFVRIDSMPLNSSGKVDRTALPPPSESNILRTHSYVAARKPIEVKVTSILADLVRMKEIGLNDNFFLMGGNSLLGAQVIAQVRDRFGIELSLLSLFDHPTAAELSSEIEQLLIEKIGALSENEAKDLAAHLTPAMHDI